MSVTKQIHKQFPDDGVLVNPDHMIAYMPTDQAQDDEASGEAPKGKPDAPVSALEANAAARYDVQHPSQDGLRARECLKFVRRSWSLQAVEPTAHSAHDHAAGRHKYNGDPDSIPYGAPVFSHRKGAPDDDSWHVFLTGGYTVKGERIFRSTDILTLGDVNCCRIEDIETKWDHVIVGWTETLNGYHLNLPDPPNHRKTDSTSHTPTKKMVPRNPVKKAVAKARGKKNT